MYQSIMFYLNYPVNSFDLKLININTDLYVLKFYKTLHIQIP